MIKLTEQAIDTSQKVITSAVLAIVEKLKEVQRKGELLGGIGLGAMAFGLRGTPMGAWELGSALGLVLWQWKILLDHGISPRSEFGQWLLQLARQENMVWKYLKMPKFLVK